MLPKSELVKIRLSGNGGQGILLSGYILGKAAVEYDGLQAVQTQSYGPEMRGTKCKSDLIISYRDTPIHFPAIERADILMAMSQEAWNAYSKILHNKSLIFIDSDLVKVNSKSSRLYPVPATKTADQLENRLVANMVMMGVLVEITQIVSKPAIERATLDIIPKSLKDLNVNALNKGYEMGKQLITKKRR